MSQKNVNHDLVFAVLEVQVKAISQTIEAGATPTSNNKLKKKLIFPIRHPLQGLTICESNPISRSYIESTPLLIYLSRQVIIDVSQI